MFLYIEMQFTSKSFSYYSHACSQMSRIVLLNWTTHSLYSNRCEVDNIQGLFYGLYWHSNSTEHSKITTENTFKQPQSWTIRYLSHYNDFVWNAKLGTLYRQFYASTNI